MSTLRNGIAALAIVCTAGVAAAQTTTPDTTTTPPAAAPTTPAATPTTPPADMPATTPATTTTDKTATNTDTTSDKPPLAGANSFTESQAKDRIAKAGFADVQSLKKDDQGIWRGQAKKDGKEVSVALDYRGNVVQE